MDLPEVTWPALTGSDVSHMTGSDVTGSHVTGRGPHETGSDCMRMCNLYSLYYYYSSSTKCSTVVQVPWLPEMTEDHVMWFPALFSPVLTRNDVTRRGFPGCAQAQPEVGVSCPFFGCLSFFISFSICFQFFYFIFLS
jgi:hypothetical protein